MGPPAEVGRPLRPACGPLTRSMFSSTTSPVAALVGLRQPKHAFAHRGHLWPVLGADDGGDDVAAEGGPDLVEQVAVLDALHLVVADAQIGAVGGQADAQRRGDARREVAPGGRRPVEHDLRLEVAHRLGHHAGVGLGQVLAEQIVRGEVDRVGAGGDERGRERPRLFVAGAHGAGAHAEPRRRARGHGPAARG